MGKKRRTKGTAEAPKAPDTVEVGFPRWVPAALFVVLTVVLFREFVFSDLMLVGNDTLGLGLVARSFYADALHEGTFPLWAPLILGGTPFLEALAGGDSLYPPSVLLLLVMETYRALGWKLVLHVLAAGFLMYGWVRAVGASRAAALVAGTAYLLAPFLVSLVHPGHDGKLFVTALAPLLFWMVERHFIRPGPARFAAVALTVGLVILTTHFQMAYFLFGAVGLFAGFRAAQLWRGSGPDEGTAPGGEGGEGEAATPGGRPRVALTRFALFLAASLTGAGVAAVQLVPAVGYVMEHSRRIQTTREAAGETGVAWSSSWSLHPEEAMSLLIPEFAGNDAQGPGWTQRTYWGRNATRDNSPYAGLIVLVLAAASFVGGARRGLRIFLVGLGGLALLFALGTHTPVWGFFYALVPGIRLFRAPDQVMFLFGFAAVTLAALGTDRLLRALGEAPEEGARTLGRVLWGGAGLMVLLALLASSGALTGFWTTVLYPDVAPRGVDALARLQPFLGRGAWIGAFLALGAAGLVHGVRAGILAPAALVAGLVILVAADELRVGSAFVQVMDYHAWAQPDPNMRTLLSLHADDPEPYRLWSLLQRSQDVKPALHGIELVAGHHPNDLSRYRELIGMIGSGEPQNLYASGQIRRLLNVRYILWPNWQRGDAPPGAVVSQSRYANGGIHETLLAEDALPRARLVADAVVRSDAEAVPYMLSPDFDPEAVVVLPEAPPIELGGGPVQGVVRWEERGPNRMSLHVESDRAALLVLAENWYPAWRATVDGRSAPVLRAYHTLRAVPVSAGSHTVEMRYESPRLAWSLRTSLLLLVALGGALAWGLRRERRGEVPA